MFRSLSRITVATAFVLALVLSTAPVQALPGAPGTQLDTFEASWFDLALSWFEDFLGGGDREPLSLTTAKPVPPSSDPGDGGVMSGSCIDPMGNPCVDIDIP